MAARHRAMLELCGLCVSKRAYPALVAQLVKWWCISQVLSLFLAVVVVHPVAWCRLGAGTEPCLPLYTRSRH